MQYGKRKNTDSQWATATRKEYQNTIAARDTGCPNNLKISNVCIPKNLVYGREEETGQQ